MTTDDGKRAPTLEQQIAYLARRNEYTLSPTTPGLDVNDIEAAILTTLRSHATLLRELQQAEAAAVEYHSIVARLQRERDELRRALPRAREAAAYAAWLDIFERFSGSQRKQLANLFAHDWTVAAVEIQSYHGEAPTRIEAPVPISVALATKKARLAALTASADKADSKSGGG